MMVSVIIPLYNKARFIQRALDSVMAQSYRDFELIVVNDGSTDKGAESVRQCNDSRVRLITQTNAGPGAARNRGLQVAQGDYVAFLDADDEWLPGFLEKAIGYLQLHDEAATITLGYRDTGREVETMADRWDSRGIRDGQYRIGQGGHSAQFVVWLLSYMSPCSTVSRKAVVLKYGGFFDKWKCLYAEDAYLWLQVLMNETVAVSRDTFVIFHREASELSNRRSPLSIPPFLIDPSEVYQRCPEDSRYLLEEILAIRAVGMATACALAGCRAEAMDLLFKFCPRYQPDHYTRALRLSRLSRVLPFVLQCWSLVRQFPGVWWCWRQIKRSREVLK